MNTKHLKQFRTKSKQAGMTLIELILALVLGGLIIFGALSIYNSAKQSSNVNSEVKAIQGVVAGVRSLYPGLSVYTGLTESLLITANKVPTSMVNGTALRHVWNGAVTVGPNATAGFDVTYAALPTSDCIELVAAVAAGFNTVTVGSTVVKPANGTLDTAASATQCAAAATATVKFNSL